MLRVHLAEHAVFCFVVTGMMVLMVRLVIRILIFHLNIALIAEVGVWLRLVSLVFCRKRWDWRYIDSGGCRAIFGSAVATAEKSHSSRQILGVFIPAVALRNGSVGCHWPAGARHAPLPVVREAVFSVRNASVREDRLVRARIDAAVTAETLAVPIRVLALRRRRGLVRAQVLVPHT